ncbi:unnamed protein product [Prorocentrum cordatum]|uniref:Uncharacterized protein n=1 Tax=Prorocentrum cordatum TaxID=2364126 RepID=A0ABN9SY73_9DINO|nr:unnamed protein product [Polarella glacialis]
MLFIPDGGFLSKWGDRNPVQAAIPCDGAVGRNGSTAPRPVAEDEIPWPVRLVPAAVSEADAGPEESPTSQRASRSRRRRLQRRWKRDLLKASLTRDDLARPALSALGAMTQGCSVLCRISSRALQGRAKGGGWQRAQAEEQTTHRQVSLLALAVPEDVRAQPRPPAMPAPGHHWRQAWAKARVSWESHIRRGHDPQAWTPRVLGHRGAEWLSWQRLIASHGQ